MKTSKLPKTISTVVAILVYFGFAVFILSRVADVLDFTVILQNRTRLFQSALLTLGISLAAVAGSLILGFFLFLMTEAKNPFCQSMAEIYKEIIMGTPLLVLVFVIVYIIGVALGIRNKLLLGFLALTLYMSPYMTNVIDGAYRSIDADQFMVMDFYHFSLYQQFRYILIPQMIRPVIPGLINNLSGIIKGTSILSTIAISEIFYTTSVLSNTSYRYIEGYFLLWVVYLVITIPLSRLAKRFARMQTN